VPSVLSNHPRQMLMTTKPEAKLSKPLTNQAVNNSVLTTQSKTNNSGTECIGFKEDNDIWDDSIEYTEWDQNGESNLFITWAGLNSDLLAKLRRESLEVRFCFRTAKKDLFNVVFKDHVNARKAFTSQVEIRLRMIPPRCSTHNWFKSPSPKFLVKYETKFRLTLRSGKASSHNIVGEFLMSNFEEKSGCYI
jgi:hypothetical protein